MTQPTNPIWFDLETQSKHNIKSVPAWQYAAEAEILRVAWCMGDRPVQVSEGLDGFFSDLEHADALVAHNLRFDLGILTRSPGVELPRSFRSRVLHSRGRCRPIDTMSMANLLNLPAAEGTLSEFLGFGQKVEMNFEADQQERQGLFGSDPELTEAREGKLTERARVDVDLMRKIYNKMAPAIPAWEWDNIATDMRINARGAPVDRALLTELYGPAKKVVDAAERRFMKLTGLGPNQHEKFKTWLMREGLGEVESTDKDALSELITRPGISADAKDALKQRLIFAEGDHAKLSSIRKHTDPADGRVHNAYSFANCVTGRWSSKGVQLHNLSRDGMARKVLVAEDGHKLWKADYHGIELRLGLWYAGEQAALEDMHNGGDPYMRIATDLFGSGATKEHRRLCKGVLLGGMFGGGLETLHTAINKGSGDPVSEEQIQQARDGMHNTYPGFMKAWDALADACRKAIRSKQDRVRHPVEGMLASFERMGTTLKMHLPTGRAVTYRGISIPADDEKGACLFEYTKRWSSKGTPIRSRIRGGFFLLNNLCQSTARDLLADALTRLDHIMDTEVVGSTHDSVYIQVKDKVADDRMAQDLHDTFVPDTELLPRGLLVGAESGWSKSWSEVE